jgi:hypothetical protein
MARFHNAGIVMQWSGWRRNGGDGRTGPMATEVTAPTGLTSRRSPVRTWSSRSSSLRGLRHPFSRVRRVGRTGVGGIVPRGCCWPCRTASHNGGDGLAGGVGGAVPGCDSQARRGMDSHLTWAPANVSALNPPCRGSRYGGGGPARSSSEAEPRSRGRSALDQDGTSLEEASSPRARRSPARGGDRPSSEAEPHPRGRPAIGRGGVLPVRHRAPLAKRSSARGWLGRLSGGPWARGFILRVFLGSFAFVFYEGKWVFPGCLGDPYGCP